MDVLKTLSSIPGLAVLIGLIVAAALLVMLVNWRLLILALGVQYLLVGLMLTRVVPLELAAVKALVGVMICPVLFITARRVRWGQIDQHDEAEADHPNDPAETERPAAKPAVRRSIIGWLISPGFPLRLMAALLTAVLAVSLALRNPLSVTNDVILSRDITIGTFGLLLLGLLNILLNENPLKVGVGLLSLLAGFEMFYTSVEPTLTIVGLLGLTNLIIGLAIAYLTTAWATHPPREAQL
ncbi:MAG: hypothetical protein KA765_18245 [Thermoflexales bacterium]|nr:hypothetical protein [Thermoflexales bacterium]